jgi:hypothetical protein
MARSPFDDTFHRAVLVLIRTQSAAKLPCRYKWIRWLQGCPPVLREESSKRTRSWWCQLALPRSRFTDAHHPVKRPMNEASRDSGLSLD